MRTISTFLFCLAAIAATAQGHTKKVLFLGNSYTSVNNLPQMVHDIALSAGDTLVFDNHTIGGYMLGQHLGNSTSINKIKTGTWDYVVLQEQSQTYAFTSRYLNNFPYARSLDSVITGFNPCAQTMFYMTWGRKNGDAYLCTAPECDTDTWITRTYAQMDSVICRSYRHAADSLDALVSPVGATWKKVRQDHPSIELFQADESHPTVSGTYAAACSFYTAIFQKDPTFATYHSSLSATDASHIKTAAKQTVYDSLSKWNIGVYDHLLPAGCLTSLKETGRQTQWKIYPNPAGTNLYIEFDANEKDQFQLYNAMGILVFETRISGDMQVNIGHLPGGLYFACLKNSPIEVMRFVKE